MRFEWDPRKAESNWRKHRVHFAAALEVFRDPLVLSEPDRFVDGEERWKAIGQIGGQLYFVAYRIDDTGDEEIVRLISARMATGQERRAYERGT